MGRRKIIKKNAQRLALGNNFRLYIDLEKKLAGRFFHRDVIALVEALELGISANGISHGACAILMYVGRIASATDADIVSSLLKKPEIYRKGESSFRMTILNILGRIGTLATVSDIESAKPFFDTIQDIPDDVYRRRESKELLEAVSAIKSRYKS